MERLKTTFKEKDVGKLADHIFQNAMGNILVLEAAPTADGDMKLNTMGFYDGTLYIRLASGGIKTVDLSDL